MAFRIFNRWKNKGRDPESDPSLLLLTRDMLDTGDMPDNSANDDDGIDGEDTGDSTDLDSGSGEVTGDSSDLDSGSYDSGSDSGGYDSGGSDGGGGDGGSW